ncbi:uncharacterized protein IUM83_04869 [Phytophthora cinnamomi]|uniref:uncharacterized protein n=1 Tax=Phytophthora cinnamomi TaxID=4785 RepID=UPI00355958E0|nr:hypothetical protein IUM83_04869 [Phytophthora cinnamomi]
MKLSQRNAYLDLKTSDVQYPVPMERSRMTVTTLALTLVQLRRTMGVESFVSCWETSATGMVEVVFDKVAVETIGSRKDLVRGMSALALQHPQHTPQ